MKYPVSLAVFDFVPVVVNFLGQLLLLNVLYLAFPSQWWMALVGILLMTLGGGLKAGWKTIIAVTERDIRWMEHALFPCLAPGACLLAWVVWNSQRLGAGLELVHPWPALVLLITVFLFWSWRKVGGSGKWFMPLVLLLTLAMGVISTNAMLIAQVSGNIFAAALFISSFGISLVTAAVSRKVATIKLQWLMETANSLSALCFLVAAYLLQ